MAQKCHSSYVAQDRLHDALCRETDIRCRQKSVANNQRYIAAVHESAVGTFETCGRRLRMSVDRGRPEVVGRGAKRRF
jgi:hypothetical protein